MPKGRVFFVVNNRSGGADEAALRDAAAKSLTAAGYECEFFVRREKGMSRRDAARRAIDLRYEVIVAAGGDGTVSRVADEIQGSKATLGIVAMGTANLIAKSLNLPLDVAEAVQLIADGRRTRTIDGMHVPDTGKTYFSHVTMGVYSIIAKQATETQKKWLGRGVYAWNLLKELTRGNAWKFTIDVDGSESRVTSSLVIVANSGNAGVAGVQWGSQIAIDDGQLDLYIIRGRSIAAYARWAWHALLGRSEADPEVGYKLVRERVKIETKSDVPVRADGGLIGDRCVTVEVRRAAVPVIVG